VGAKLSSRHRIVVVVLLLGLLPSQLGLTGIAEGKGGGIVACKGGKAGIYPCRNVDLQSVVSNSELNGGRASDIWGWADPKTKHEYALMGSTKGLEFIDITMPTKPVYLGSLAPKPDGALIWQDVEVYKDYAFVVCDLAPCGVQIFDLTRLRDAGNGPQTWTPDLVYPVAIAHTIDINPETGFLYINGSFTLGGGTHIVDINDPAKPVPAGFILDDGYTHDSHCRIYRGPDKDFNGKEICFNFNEDSITTYDVTNKMAPVQLSKVTYEGASYTHSGWLSKDNSFIFAADETDEETFKFPTTTYIWDVSDLTKPKLVETFRAKTNAIDHNNYVLGDLVYQANYVAGLRIMDASDIDRGVFKEIGYFDIVPESDEPTYDGAWAVYPYLPSGNVIISGMGQGLFVVRPKV
jgi:choice-of-anchor B domain-containing protein